MKAINYLLLNPRDIYTIKSKILNKHFKRKTIRQKYKKDKAVVEILLGTDGAERAKLGWEMIRLSRRGNLGRD